jgi:hypothetical protein
MQLEELLGQSWSYKALGVATLGLAAALVLAIVQRFRRRSKSEGDLDDRVVKLSDVQDGIIEDLRIENSRLHGKLDDASLRYANLVDSIQNRIEAVLARVEAQHQDQIQRLHQRIDDTEAKHEACEEERKADRLANDRRFAELEKYVRPKRRTSPA